MPSNNWWMLVPFLGALLASAQPSPNSPAPGWQPPPLSGSEEALERYQELSGKTLLRPASLPSLPESITADLPTNKDQALARIENDLAKSGIQMVQDGPHFVRVYPQGMSFTLSEVPLRGAELSASGKGEMIPTGAINFPATALDQVLTIYAELRNRTILRTAILPPAVIKLKTASPLTREEVAYAMTTVLALNGISAVDDGEHFVQVVIRAQLKQVKTLAPKPLAGATLLDPKRIPKVGAGEVRPLTKGTAERAMERARQLFYDFLRLPDPRHLYAERLAKLYADLSDKEVVPSANLGTTFITFFVQTPLTKDELLYGIQTTLELNNLTIVPIDEKTLRLGPISEMTEGTRRGVVATPPTSDRSTARPR